MVLDLKNNNTKDPKVKKIFYVLLIFLFIVTLIFNYLIIIPYVYFSKQLFIDLTRSCNMPK